MTFLAPQDDTQDRHTMYTLSHSMVSPSPHPLTTSQGGGVMDIYKTEVPRYSPPPSHSYTEYRESMTKPITFPTLSQSVYLELPYIWLCYGCCRNCNPTTMRSMRIQWSSLEIFRVNFRQFKSMMYTDGEIIQIGEIHHGARMGEAKRITFKSRHLNCV